MEEGSTRHVVARGDWQTNVKAEWAHGRQTALSNNKSTERNG